MSFALELQAALRRFVFLVALTLVALIGYVDCMTGYEVSLFVFYAVPIMLTVWFADRRTAMLIALLSAIVWWWADAKSGHIYLNEIGEIWETAVRLAFFFFVAMGGAAMKNQHDAVQAQLAAVNRQRQLEQEIVSASEREQQRIGQDLHDGLCQVLAGICCAATSLKDDLHQRFSPEAESAAEIEELLRDAIMQARNVARGIAPVHMDECGLVSALDELASHTSHLTGVACTFSSEEERPAMEPQTAAHLYRIAQEALNNAAKHSGAKKVEITLQPDAGHLVLAIRDDGCGLPETPPRQAGMGLKTMHYRARVIGASLRIESAGEGTCVTCTVPMPTVAPDHELIPC